MSMIKCFKFALCCMIMIPALATAANKTPPNDDEELFSDKAYLLTSLSPNGVKAAFSDKTFSTISAATLNGNLISNKFTGYFSNDGKMTGRFSTKPDDGPQQDNGTWKVNSDGTLCYKWDKWNSGQEKCSTIYKLSNGFLVVNSQNGFESFIPDNEMKSGNQFKD